MNDGGGKVAPKRKILEGSMRAMEHFISRMTRAKIENANKPNAWFIVPKTNRIGTMHIILSVTDDGSPALTRYQRVIINILP
jgi:hypothetical protein